jgi:hypothetical protein
VQFALPDHGTNFVFSTSPSQGYYYTMQSSSDLSNWTALTALYAGSGSALNWTTLISTQGGMQMFRAKVNPPNATIITNYHGWNNAILLSNGLVEALVVPSAGRVMQFRFAGTTNGPFWENPKLYGHTSSSTNWNTTGAFGGDKSWPAPQSDWSGGWPPPTGFDGSAYTYGLNNGVVTITSPVDSGYKIQVTRTIQLDFDQPVLRINTVFQRSSGATHTNVLAVWVITQVSDPVGIYVPVPAQSVFAPTDYYQLGTGLPTQYQNANGLISFTRDPAAQHHLGFDANSLAWVGTNVSMRIDSSRVAGINKTNYPNGGCNTVVYTNNGYTNNVGDACYAEMECFATLTNLTAGQSVSFSTVYTLFNRTQSDPTAEARKVLGLASQ